MSNQATVVENSTPKDNKKSGKTGRYQGFLKRQEKDEEELAALEAARKAKAEGRAAEEDPDSVPDENLNAEEKTFKKRYGDLRRHMQRKEDEHKEAVKALEERLEAQAKTVAANMQLPATEKELDEFLETRPDVSRVIETMIEKRARKLTEDLDERFKRLQTAQSELTTEQAEVKLLRAHPDLEQIQESPEFHAWVSKQAEELGEDFEKKIYDNTNWREVAREITVFKNETGWGKKKPSPKKDTTAAESVSTKSQAPDPGSNAKKFRESDVRRMSDAEYEAKEDEIEEAIRTGNFIYDLSGAAR